MHRRRVPQRALPDNLPDDPEEARKYKRMVKNRKSAARSRQRRQDYTAVLEEEIKTLKDENSKLRQQVADMPPAGRGPKLRRASTF